MTATEKMSQTMSLIADIPPASYSAQTNSDGIDMKLFNRVMFVVLAGVVGTQTCAGVIKGGTDNSTFATTITGKSLSAGTFSGTIDNNKQALIEVTASECAAQDVRYIRLELTPSGAGLYSAVALGGVVRYQPASDLNLSSVNEIVA